MANVCAGGGSFVFTVHYLFGYFCNVSSSPSLSLCVCLRTFAFICRFLNLFHLHAHLIQVN